MIKPFKYLVTFGDMCMGFEDLGEAIFAATGCYEFVQGLGYPSVIGAFVENTLDIEPYGYFFQEEDEEFTSKDFLDLYEWDGTSYSKLVISELV